MKDQPSVLTAAAAQFPVSLDLAGNLAAMRSILRQTPAGSLLVFPEGALSGYDENPAFLGQLDPHAIKAGIRTLADEARSHGIHLFFGTCLAEAGRWYNAGVYVGPQGEQVIYRKVNLATSERGAFAAGDALQSFEIRHHGASVRVAMQLCREIRFPEQWQHLARQGVQVFVYMTNAVGDVAQAAVWRCHLVSRAAENQRFVIAANNAHAAQKCPTMLVSPVGEVLGEVLGSDLASVSATFDVTTTSDWYLSQSRGDLLAGRGH